MTYDKLNAVNVLILNTVYNKNTRHTRYHEVAHLLRITDVDSDKEKKERCKQRQMSRRTGKSDATVRFMKRNADIIPS
jgi:hypothetical protein